MDLFERSWEEREEKVYKGLFGDMGPGIYPLTPEIFTQNFQQDKYDPRWLHYGVFKSPPTPDRNSWLYVSSGMSNSWEHNEPQEYSGLGVEFVIETNEDSDWPIEIVRNLIAYNVLLACGRFGDRPLIDYGDRVPFAIARKDNEPIKIRALLIVEPSHYPASFSLESGKVGFLHVIGISPSEWELAKINGSDALLSELKKAKVYPLTDRNRESIVA